MIKKTLLAASISLLSLAAQAGPVLVVIDNFNSGFQALGLVAPGTVSNTNSIRTITDTLHASTAPVLNSVGVFDQGLGNGNGIFDVSNGPGEDATAKVSWNVAAGLVSPMATNMAFRLDVIFSDFNPTNLSFSFGGNTIGNYVLTDVHNQLVDFALSGVDFSRGGELTMTVHGAPGWDMTLDSFGLAFDAPNPTVPEPGSVALVGAALLGAAVARRRRSK